MPAIARIILKSLLSAHTAHSLHTSRICFYVYFLLVIFIAKGRVYNELVELYNFWTLRLVFQINLTVSELSSSIYLVIRDNLVFSF